MKVVRARRLIGAILTFLVISLTSATLMVSPASASYAVPSRCADVLFIGARGSGEPGPGSRSGWTPSSDDPLGLGKTVLSAQRRMTAHLGGRRSVSTISVEYPADAVTTIPFHADEYFAGLAEGVTFTESLLREHAYRCPPTEQIVLAGYSQGAMVMHRTVQQLNTSTSGRQILERLNAAILIGDGDRVKNDTTQNFGSMHSNREGIGLAWQSQSGSGTKKFPSSLGARVLEVCNQDDPVCDYPGLNLSVHSGYPDSSALAEATIVGGNDVLAVPLPTPRVVHIVETPGVALVRQLVADVDSDYELEWGVAPYNTMPAGLTLSKSGLVSGTPVDLYFGGSTDIRVRAVILGVKGPWVPGTLVWDVDVPQVWPIYRVSLANDGLQGDADTVGYAAISDDGRYVAFSSYASNLPYGGSYLGDYDTNGSSDVFVRDRQLGATVRASVASDGTEANGFSAYPSMSADGRYVAFYSQASNLVLGGRTPAGGVFVHDMRTGTTTQVNVATDGSPDNFAFGMDPPVISANGRYVVFSSRGSNLVPGDTSPGYFDVFRRDLLTGTTIRISATLEGIPGNNHSRRATISADGNRIAFASQASNLVDNDTNGSGDIFVRDVLAGTITRASVANNGDQANTFGYGDGENPTSTASISADGTHVAFISPAANLVSGDTNNTSDVFVRDQSAQTTLRVSISTEGTEGNKVDQFAFAPSLSPNSISANGSKVTFWSESTNLVPGDTNGTVDVFVRDLTAATTTRVSLAHDASQRSAHSLWPTMSSDGRFILFDSRGYFTPWDNNGGATTYIYGD